MNAYEKHAKAMAEQLFDDGLDLDRFIPALMREVKDIAETIERESADYEPDSINWAETQLIETKVYLETLGEAVSELGAAISQSLPTDDANILCHMHVTRALLYNLKRRMEAKS